MPFLLLSSYNPSLTSTQNNIWESGGGQVGSLLNLVPDEFTAQWFRSGISAVEFILSIINSAVAPAWPVREESVVPFVWAYGARELIVERKSVGKIVALRAAVECVKIGDCNRNFGSQFHFLDVPMSFHEAFVSWDEQRARVVRRVHMHYDLDRKNNVVALRTADFPETAPGRFRNEVALLEKEVSRWATGVE